MLVRLGLGDRRGERVEKLFRRFAAPRRAGQGHAASPRLVILDEPSTGLDPGARSDLWEYLEQIRREERGHDRPHDALCSKKLKRPIGSPS